LVEEIEALIKHDCATHVSLHETIMLFILKASMLRHLLLPLQLDVGVKGSIEAAVHAPHHYLEPDAPIDQHRN